MNTDIGPADLLRQRYSDIIGLADRWFWETDKHLRLVYISGNAQAVTGMPPGRLRGTMLPDLLSGGAAPECGRRALVALSEHMPFDEEIRHGQPPEKQYFTRLVGVPVFDEQGGFSGYRGIGKNSRDEKARPPQARSNDRMLTDAVEGLPIGFTLYDADDRLVFWNAAYVTLYPGIEDVVSPGMLFGEAIQALLKHNIAPDGKGDNRDFAELARRHRRDRHASMELNLKDGRWIQVESQRTAAGGTVCLHTDITERKAAEDSLAQSEQRFAMAFQFNPGVTAIADIEDGTQLAVNDNWLEVFGWQRAEVIGKTSLELGIWADPAERALFIGKLKSDGRVRNYQSRFRTRGGEVLDVLVSGETIQLEGKPRLLIAGHDISDRKRIEDALKYSEARLSGILNITPESVIILDDSLRITSFNRGAERTFGYDEAEALGKSVDFLVPGHLWSVHAGHVQQFVSSGERSRSMGMRGRISGLRKDGVEFPADASISRLEVDGEKLFVVLLRDVTEQYEAEQALHAAKEEAEFSNRAMSEFLANMSHELRTPLNAILGFSQVIRDRALGPVEGENYLTYADDIYESGKHLLDIIADILDLSKIDAGHTRIDEEEIDMLRLLDSCINLVRGRAAAADLTLTADYDEPLRPLRGESLRVKQIVINLLSNAIKFTPAGGSVVLEAGSGKQGEHLLTITDTGIGIDPDDVPLIFEPFSQIEHSLTRKHEGTGLGLPLVKKLCELHDASIEIESVPGRGTKIQIRFPPERTV